MLDSTVPAVLENLLAETKADHERETLIRAWTTTGMIALARQAGRAVAVEHAENLAAFVRGAPLPTGRLLTQPKPQRDGDR